MQDISQRDADFEKAIRQRNVQAIRQMMFESNIPKLRPGFCVETDIWDFKKDCPRIGKNKCDQAWADLSKDVLAFHNSRGGAIIFGICDDLSFSGAIQRLDSKLLNDQLRKYLGDLTWIEFHREFIQSDQRYLGIAIIPPRGASIERFKSDAPLNNGRRLFFKGDSAIRENDSTRVLPREEADEYARKLIIPTIGKVYEIDTPFFRVLSPDYVQFVERIEYCQAIERSLSDKRYSVTSLIGIGGAGKTALATWATLRAFQSKSFSFIVSVTAKDRELTASGIQSLKPGLTSFEALLNSILDVLEFPEHKANPISEKERNVRNVIAHSDGLLYVDNLETVDDSRIIAFLDDLPEGVRALTTSRRSRVRVSVRPIEIGALSESEIVNLIISLRKQPGKSFISDLSESECLRIGDSCDRLPLGIKWVLSKAASPSEALSEADSVTKSGRRGEQLLEFCFRRVFDTMPSLDKSVLQVLSLHQRSLPLEAVLVGTGSNQSLTKLQDAIDQLVEDALVQRQFDPQLNDYCYTLLPITRAFVATQVSRDTDVSGKMMKRLSEYYEATDIKDRDQRLIVREIRQGGNSQEAGLVELAIAAERRRDFNTAERLYEQALSRNPRNWEAASRFARFQRQKRGNSSAALRLYEQAAANAPSRGSERALIFREWGILLKDSGLSDATNLAIEKFNEVLKEAPNDSLAKYELARMYERKGIYLEVIRLMEPLVNNEDKTARGYAYPLLQNAYEKTRDMIKLIELREKMESESKY
jgi:tetratricopeptide (TPR) repeat protein